MLVMASAASRRWPRQRPWRRCSPAGSSRSRSPSPARRISTFVTFCSCLGASPDASGGAGAAAASRQALRMMHAESAATATKPPATPCPLVAAGGHPVWAHWHCRCRLPIGLGSGVRDCSMTLSTARCGQQERHTLSDSRTGMRMARQVAAFGDGCEAELGGSSQAREPDPLAARARAPP